MNEFTRLVHILHQRNLLKAYRHVIKWATHDIKCTDIEALEIQMTIESIIKELFEQRAYEEADALIQLFIKRNYRILQTLDFEIISELIYFHLFYDRTANAEQYLRILATKAEEDLLLFAHLLDVFDAYGHTEIITQVVTETISTSKRLDQEDRLLLGSYIVATDPFSENKNLTPIRQKFIQYCSDKKIHALTAENIFDAVSDYLDNSLPSKEKNWLLLDEKSFRCYIATLLDVEYLDTFEYAASVLWGAAYFFQFLFEQQKISNQDLHQNLQIISRTKAFLWINIPWEGYWRLRFLCQWAGLEPIPSQEKEAEKEIINQNILLSNLNNQSDPVQTIFGQQMSHLSYGSHLSQEWDSWLKKNSQQRVNENLPLR